MKTYPILVSLVVGAGALTAFGQEMTSSANPPPPPPPSNAPAYQSQYPSKAVITLDVPGEISALQSTPFDNRETVISDVRKHAGQAHHSVVKLRFKNDVTFHRPAGDAKVQYQTALEDEKAAKMDLDARLKEAHATNDPQSWDHARMELANSYQRYADAVGHAEAIATGHYDGVAMNQPTQ